MTLKPRAEMNEETTEDCDYQADNDDNTTHINSDMPETNDENDNQQQENHPPNTRQQFYVGQQLDILDSVQYWTEAEVIRSILDLLTLR
jgi:hypothetical protein